MRKSYLAPEVNELGAVSALTAAFGSAPEIDVSEFPAIPVATGSFDVCEEEVCGTP